jgi:hypothetical protein
VAIERENDRGYNATGMIIEKKIERREEKLRRSRFIWGEREVRSLGDVLQTGDASPS